jgi:lipoprotein-anchoring transpeptidase ErfK/SrfK
VRIPRLIAPLSVAILSLFTLHQAAHAALLVEINKSTQQMTITLNDAPIYHWPISTGAAGYDTPSGTFRPFRMEIDHYSDEWDNAPMPYSIFFTDTGVAVHGTYEQRLGRAVSHGCVRLSVKNAATLWNLVKQEKMANTSVVVTGDIPAAGSTATASRPMPLSTSNQRYRALPPPFFTFGR